MIPDLMAPPEAHGTSRSGLAYRILGKVQPTLVVDLDREHELVSDAGGMSWMTSTVEMNANVTGGLARAFAGATVFLLHFRTASLGQVAFAADFPGTILPLELGPGEGTPSSTPSSPARRGSSSLALWRCSSPRSPSTCGP